MRSSWAAFAIGLAACSASSSDGQPDNLAVARPAAAFDQFWSSFRSAALAGDTVRLMAMAQPMLTLPGELDDDPVQTVPKTQLAQLLPKVMAQDSQTNSRQSVTNRALIESLPTVPRFGPGVAVGLKGAQVGPFQFKNAGQGWLLTGLIVKTSDEQ